MNFSNSDFQLEELNEKIFSLEERLAFVEAKLEWILSGKDENQELKQLAYFDSESGEVYSIEDFLG